MSGSVSILEQFERQLKIKAGETSKNGLVSLEVSQCIGACGLAPVVLVNDKFYSGITTEKITEIIECVKETQED